MRRFKIFVIILVAVCAILGVIYLMSIAKDMERYTISSSGSSYGFVLVSSSKEGFKNISEKKELLEYAAGLLKGAGYSCSYVEIGGMDNKTAEEAIQKAMKGAGRYILLDICPTKLVVSDKSLILRVSRLEEGRYHNNLEYAKTVKAGIKDEGIVVHIISDDKNWYYQSLGEKCLRLELWDNIADDKAKELISTTLSAVIK